MAAVGLVFAVLLVRELAVSRPLPAPPAARAPLSSPTLGATPAPESGPAPDVSAYSVIFARNLFNPTRSDTSTVAAARPTAKPVLHGVVLDGQRSRAYIEDPLAKGVFGYTVGDTVGQGQIKAISADRITISGPEGTFEVLLHDPSKPRPAAPGVPGAAAAPQPAAVSQPPAPQPAGAPGGPAVRRSRPGPAPGQPPVPGSQPSDN